MHVSQRRQSPFFWRLRATTQGVMCAAAMGDAVCVELGQAAGHAQRRRRAAACSSSPLPRKPMRTGRPHFHAVVQLVHRFALLAAAR